jgi:hypothetical protein
MIEFHEIIALEIQQFPLINFGVKDAKIFKNRLIRG